MYVRLCVCVFAGRVGAGGVRQRRKGGGGVFTERRPADLLGHLLSDRLNQLLVGRVLGVHFFHLAAHDRSVELVLERILPCPVPAVENYQRGATSQP